MDTTEHNPNGELPPHVERRLGLDADLQVDGSGDWPAAVDVLVVGAGPAGSACAIELARAGHSVLLVDQHDFPRDKICGEGLIPDAHAALRHLGVLDAVMARAQPVAHVRCVAPRGGQVDVPGRLAVLPRQVLDTLLVQQAQRCGVTLRTPWRFDGLIESDGRVRGARLRAAGPVSGEAASMRELATRWVVMATGAAVPALIKADLCERRTPTGIALRVHVHAPDLADRLTTMDVVWHRALRPGYGWIFPCGDGLFNIGVGAFFQRGQSGEGANLNELFDAFTRVHAPARELMQQARWRGQTKGAPLRCTLRGSRLGRPGVLATGEAIGSTYDFSGEGIGKAMETGMLAAACIREAADDAAVLARYQAAVAALQPRFDLYEKANQVNHHPWLADLVIWRARRSPSVLRRMSGVLEETSNPGNLLSLKGLMRLFSSR